MEIKLREVIFSVVIVSIMVIIGFKLSDSIKQSQLEAYQRYDTALEVTDEDSFRYAISTDIGYTFAYGQLIALDPVTFPEIDGEYSYIKKEEQEYVRHSREVTETYTDSNGKTHTRTRTEYYWTWDTMRTERKYSTKISFMNVEFDYGKIMFPSSSQIAIIDTGYNERNVYYATGTTFQGTIFTNLESNTINDTSFYENQTIEETKEYLKSDISIVVFWIFWIMLTAGAVWLFLSLENKWLD